MPGWQLEPIGKWLPLEFFVKIIYATSMDPLFQQLFYFHYYFCPPDKG